MTVMTATERQLMKKLIEEQDARAKAVNDVWKRLEQIEAQVNSLKAASATTATAAASRPAVASAEVQELKAELDKQRNATNARYDNLEHSVEVLRASLGRVEMEAQQAVGKCNDSSNALGKRLDDEIKSLKTNPPGGGPLEEKNVQKAMESPPPMSVNAEPERKLAGTTVGKSDDMLDKLRDQVKGLDEKQQQTVKELGVVRSVLIEVHVNLPLHALRASRIALRSTELSREERKLALSSLEAKEQHIRADIERVRERNDQSPELVLSEFRALNGGEP